MVDVLHRRLRVERDQGVLELVGAEARDDVRGHEHELVADVDLAAPDVRLELRGRQAAVAVGIGQGRQARLADEVGLGRPDGADVHLVAADHRDADADRASAGLEAERSRWWASRLLAIWIAFWRQTRIPADSS